MRIVVIGSGFGGVNAAVEIRKKLKEPKDEIIVISDIAQFVFRPSLIWLPFHKQKLKKVNQLLSALRRIIRTQVLPMSFYLSCLRI
ncbi:hypothetical protein [Sporosarcina globispora]|uniref:hypothetical protein n=1 Tax=Sporosarcina globispora TaxID=1459 RepID=UPI00128F4855|nr:hypothetical protein [Sporosarcina globispora]